MELQHTRYLGNSCASLRDDMMPACAPGVVGEHLMAPYIHESSHGELKTYMGLAASRASKQVYCP